ncbi:MAG: CDP-diacylglycerol--serine O-phosphatidyltransferase [Candidatus Azobacteroides sp.]|nr:CDP-diacylglycerol--serine O-phosphatidyltransferase [Candidatus Azobacteroides sp.]
MKSIPNFVTCLNLYAGCTACVMALKFDNYVYAFIFIACAAVFDFLDGLLARLLRAYSKIGSELDSLADVVSFGVAPGCVLYAFFMELGSQAPMPGLQILAFLLPIFSAYRLANFNIDTRQTTSFLGLPVPASGLFWSSFIPSILCYTEKCPMAFAIGMILLLIIFCFLMVSEIPMFSLKIKSLRWKRNQWPFMQVLISIGLLILFSIAGMPLLGVSLIVIVYIGMSLLKNVLSKNQ